MKTRCSTKISRTCEGCGKEFPAYRSLVKLGSAKFCKMACKRIKQAQVARTCVVCGKAFKTYQAEIRKGSGLCCSILCRNRRLAKANIKPLHERFWNKVVKTDTCWLWTGAKTQDGYGMIKRRESKSNVRANRLSYEIHFGQIPKGMHVLHRCDNPPCVRPGHLFLGTDADNTADCIAKGRHSKCGARNGGSKPANKSVHAITPAGPGQKSSSQAMPTE